MKILWEFAFSICWCHSVLSNKSATHFHLLHEFLISSFLMFFYNSTQDLHSGEFLERLGHCFFLGANTIAIPKTLQTIPFNTFFSCVNYPEWIFFFLLSRILLHHSIYSLVQFTLSVMSDSLRPHGPQHTRSPCPSPAPIYSNSCPLSRTSMYQFWGWHS